MQESDEIKRDYIKKEILVSFRIIKFMIFIMFIKSWFNNKKSRSNRPKICRLIRIKSQKPLNCKKTPEIESLF